MVYQNPKSRSFCICRGVPKGFVLGLVLFSLFISDLSASLPSSVSWSLYAGNLAIWSTSPWVSAAVEATEGALIRLERWSEYWSFPFNPSNCLSTPSSVSIPLQLFLGIFDRTLSFSKHVSLLKAKFFPRLKVLRCISASTRGSLRSPSFFYIKLFFGPFSLMLHPDDLLFITLPT